MTFLILLPKLYFRSFLSLVFSKYSHILNCKMIKFYMSYALRNALFNKNDIKPFLVHHNFCIFRFQLNRCYRFN